MRPSRTYKLRAPGITDYPIFFTIVGAAEPEAFFINSKALESFQWITSLMTSFYRRMADPIDISSMVGPVDVRAVKRIRILSIINDMKETFDPNGSYILPDGSGLEVHSVVHHMGLILEYHLELLDTEGISC